MVDIINHLPCLIELDTFKASLKNYEAKELYNLSIIFKTNDTWMSIIFNCNFRGNPSYHTKADFLAFPNKGIKSEICDFISFFSRLIFILSTLMALNSILPNNVKNDLVVKLSKEISVDISS